MPEAASTPDPTLLCLVPCLVVFVLAAFTKRTVEPLLAGVAVGLLMVGSPTGAADAGPLSAMSSLLDGLANGLLTVLADDVIRWIVLVCGLFGALIHVQTCTGGAQAIGSLLGRVVTGPRGVLIATWLLGLAIFVDDYLNALTVGSTMRRLADRFGVSRALLAYVVDSTAAPVCVLMPLSTWALYVAGLLEAEGVAEPGAGLTTYVGLLGTMVYAWVALGLVLIVAFSGWPVVGAMRREEAAASVARDEATNADDPAEATTGVWRRAATFLLPLVVLIGSVMAFPAADDNRVLKGVMLGLVVAVLLGRLLVGIRLVSLMEAAIEGFGRMVPALMIVVVSFVLRDVNEQLRLTDYLIATCEPVLNARLLPAFAFLGLSLVTFTTGSFWGTYAIALPLVVPLAQQTGGDVGLTIGAVVSAGVFGSHACFYGDSTVLSSASCGVDNMIHALTQLPYAAAAAAISFVIYLMWGAVL